MTAAAAVNLMSEAREADEAYFAALDSQRALVLRRRIKWYCIVATAILWLAFVMNIRSGYFQTAEGAAALGDVAESRAHVMTTGLLLMLYVPALVYVLKVRAGRKSLVQLLSVLTIGAISIAVPREVISSWANEPSWQGETAAQTLETTGYQAVNALGMLYLLACVLVPMRLRESGLIISVCSAVCAAVLGLMLRPGVELGAGLSWLLLVYAVIGTGWSAWRYRMFDFYFRAERLREKYNSLSGEAREISAELSQARRLHEALFPMEVKTGPIQVAYRYEPMREIGGDFLYVHQDPGGALSVVLIDVSGHGIAAALAVNRLHGEMQRFFSHYPVASGESGRPGHLLMNLNTYACAALAPQGVYATALVVRFEPAAADRSGRLEWASAGHPTAFVRGGTGQVYDLPSTAVMLGVIDAELFDAGAKQLGFQPGDCLLAYTDGAMEARDASGKDFSAARIRSVLQFAAIAASTGKTMSSGSVARTLADQVAKHRRGRVEDDTLIVEVMATAAIGSSAKAVGDAVKVGS